MDSRLELLREAATEFVSPNAIDVNDNWNAVSFRLGLRAITIVLGAGTDESFTVLVDSDYEGTLRLKANLVEDIVDDIGRKSLWMCEPEYRSGEGRRYPMPPGPAYSLLALGVVVAGVVGYHLYGLLFNLKDCMETAYRLLNEINGAVEVPKTHNCEDDPKFLKNMVESYIYLIV